MIKNDKQLHITKLKLKEFTEAVEALNREEMTDPILREIQVNALNSQIDDFRKEIEEYQELKEGKISQVTIDSFINIYEALIKGRIARGWTQAELAQKMNLKEQQIQRYEAGNYLTASMPRIAEVFDTLELKLQPFKIDIGKLL